MAESFTMPGVTCDVATIDALRPEDIPADSRFKHQLLFGIDDYKHNQFCDCAFLYAFKFTQHYVNGHAVAAPFPKQGNDGNVAWIAEDQQSYDYRVNAYFTDLLTKGRTETQAQMAKQIWNGQKLMIAATRQNWGPTLTPHGQEFLGSLKARYVNDGSMTMGLVDDGFAFPPGSTLSKVEMTIQYEPSEDYWRCMRPAIGQPWTEVGAALRNIPKRNAGFFYDITRILFTIDEREYTATNLWKTFFTNLPKFVVLCIKGSLFAPWLGLPAVASLATGVPVMLLPFMRLEFEHANGAPLEKLSATQQNEFSHLISDPVLKGFPNMLGSILTYLGKCGIGINIPCGVGVVLKTAAQMQIDDGSINDLHDAVLIGIVRFLAQAGDKVVDQIVSLASGRIGLDFFALIEGVCGIISTDLYRIASTTRDVQQQQTLNDVASALLIVSLTAKAGGIIAQGIQTNTPIAQIMDKVCEALVGFYPSVFEQYLADGGIKAAADYVTKSLKTVARKNPDGSNPSIVDVLAHVRGVDQTLTSILVVLKQIDQTLGGALKDVVIAFSSVTEALRQAVLAAKASATQLQTRVQNTLAQAGGQITTTTASPGTPKTPAQASAAAAWKKLLLPAAGGTVGTLVAGPIGTAAGAAGGAWLTKKIGFAGYGGAGPVVNPSNGALMRRLPTRRNTRQSPRMAALAAFYGDTATPDQIMGTATVNAGIIPGTGSDLGVQLQSDYPIKGGVPEASASGAGTIDPSTGLPATGSSLPPPGAQTLVAVTPAAQQGIGTLLMAAAALYIVTR